MKEAQLPAEVAQLIPLRHARAFLATEIEWIESHYGALCDFVHPNASSQRTTAALVGDSDTAVSSAGGGLLLSEPTLIVQYGFPMPERGRDAVRATAERALANVKGIFAATNALPQTPYRTEELLSRTGSPIGISALNKPKRRNLAAVGRNDSCPCGSGRKFKKCHGVPRKS
jgi:hypothetical protein